ncbi:hypothetical protein I79_003505 [Cricetulus griseus]|uniref:Uncharacterized protein n=1 Tax=Cricetulus griseus TaxID=10029 RepID=G3H058_CRIGR|nr:hypothetical protein I79_003505 [Cricetulus griseus]
MDAIPGPSILHDKFQGFQYLQPSFFFWSIINLQITNDDWLQPLQVPDSEDPQPKKRRENEMLRS